MTLALQGQAVALTGQVEFKSSACFVKPEPLTGSLAGTTVKFAVDSGGIKATFTGELAGASLSGTMVVTCAAGTGTGTWQATKG